MSTKRPKKIKMKVNAISEGIWKIKKEKTDDGKTIETMVIEASFSMKGMLKDISYSVTIKGNIGKVSALKKDLRVTQLKDNLAMSIFPNQQTTLDEHNE